MNDLEWNKRRTEKTVCTYLTAGCFDFINVSASLAALATIIACSGSYRLLFLVGVDEYEVVGEDDEFLPPLDKPSNSLTTVNKTKVKLWNQHIVYKEK